ECVPGGDPGELVAGDVFLQGGYPEHFVDVDGDAQGEHRCGGQPHGGVGGEQEQRWQEAEGDDGAGQQGAGGPGPPRDDAASDEAEGLCGDDHGPGAGAAVMLFGDDGAEHVDAGPQAQVDDGELGDGYPQPLPGADFLPAFAQVGGDRAAALGVACPR